MKGFSIATSGSTIRAGAGAVAFAIIGLTACSTASTSPGDAAQSDLPTPELTIPVTDPPVTTTAPPTTPPATTAPPAAVTTETPAIEPIALAYSPPPVTMVAALESPLVAVGTSNGEETARVQARLLEFGFWLQATDGNYGLTTTQAVMAFQKYHGLPTSASVDEQTAALLSTAGERANGRADAGTLVEIDKTRQLLFIVVDGEAVWAFNSSTGTEVPYETVNDKDPTKVERGDSVTPVGLYHTERERPEGWWAGDLGEIYRPKYFVGGIAVHGSNSIPNYPASHGCVRVSVPAMDFIWESDLMPLGVNVWVHGDIPLDSN
jgi:peptidoglycan hydrolase-like protein with peptidoglycan-binding domain